MILEIYLVKHPINFRHRDANYTSWTFVGHAKCLAVIFLPDFSHNLISEVTLNVLDLVDEPRFELLLISVHDFLYVNRLDEGLDVVVSDVVSRFEIEVKDGIVDDHDHGLLELENLIEHLFIYVGVELFPNVIIITALLINHHIFQRVASVNIFEAPSHTSFGTNLLLEVICIAC